jgi:hypothetical protein
VPSAARAARSPARWQCARCAQSPVGWVNTRRIVACRSGRFPGRSSALGRVNFRLRAELHAACGISHEANVYLHLLRRAVREGATGPALGAPRISLVKVGSASASLARRAWELERGRKTTGAFAWRSDAAARASCPERTTRIGEGPPARYLERSHRRPPSAQGAPARPRAATAPTRGRAGAGREFADVARHGARAAVAREDLAVGREFTERAAAGQSVKRNPSVVAPRAAHVSALDRPCRDRVAQSAGCVYGIPIFPSGRFTDLHAARMARSYHSRENPPGRLVLAVRLLPVGRGAGDMGGLDVLCALLRRQMAARSRAGVQRPAET